MRQRCRQIKMQACSQLGRRNTTIPLATTQEAACPLTSLQSPPTSPKRRLNWYRRALGKLEQLQQMGQLILLDDWQGSLKTISGSFIPGQGKTALFYSPAEIKHWSKESTALWRKELEGDQHNCTNKW